MEKTKDKVSCAYKEIYEILKIFPKELVDRIPKYKLDYIKQNMDESYEYNITKETFDGKTMLDETAAILAILFRDYWATEKQKNKMTIILTTHYMEEAESLSDRVGIMASGNLIDVGTPEELIKKSGEKNFEDAFVKIATGGEL